MTLKGVSNKMPNTKISITEVGDILKACELLEKHFGETGQTWLGRIFWLASKEVQNKMQEALNEYKAFYKLPVEERMIKAGFKKNKEGNLEKTIIL